jgi:hypothetical protein
MVSFVDVIGLHVGVIAREGEEEKDRKCFTFMH